MCGIAGIWNSSGNVDDEIIKKMTSVLHHRGPDDDGIWIDKNHGISLGHRRLSILDLTPSGKQPMLSSNERYVIVFNGEIYNHLKLRKTLEKDGHHINWRGHSDTETLINAIQCWGLDSALNQSVGMFAFALWDRESSTLTLARDRVGEKPLYYGHVDNKFIFGSELKALRAHPSFKNEINRDALALYMRHNYIPAPYTIFKNIKKLIPGSYIQLNETTDNPHPIQYWSARKVAEYGQNNLFQGDSNEAISTLNDLLSSSINDQLLSDVPLGAFLSGGIDSSTIVALMQKHCDKSVRTFSIGFNEQDYNEAEHAKAVANHLKTEHTELYVSSEDAIAVIPQLPSIYDEPFADSSQIPTFIVSQLARQHVTVCLSGDGGDELFGGYNRYLYTIKIWKTFSLGLPHAFRTALAGVLMNLNPSAINTILNKIIWCLPKKYRFKNIGNKLQKVAELFSANTPEDIYLELLSHWKNPSTIVIDGKELPTALTNKDLWATMPDFESSMMYLDLVSYLPDDIMVKVDRAAMAIGLETRMPFLDHKLIEFAWSLPLNLKIKSGRGKWILKQLLYQNVPEKLLNRPKMGFGVPIDEWFRGPLREWVNQLLDERKMKEQGYLNPDPIQEKWKLHLSGKQNWQYLLWDVLMFQAWLEETQ